MSFEEVRNEEIPNLHWILFASIVIVICAAFYKYYFSQDYLYLLEAACDPRIHAACYMRDCENDYCPPNGLSTYRVFSLPAYSFAMCIDNQCQNICPSEKYACVEIPCEGDACSGRSSL